MQLHISDHSGSPLYRQIYEQIRLQILRGELQAGEALPPIRTLAKELCVSVIPVKRAWEDLEREGYLDTRVGRGSFVRSLSAEERQSRKASLAEEKLMEEIRAAKALGLERETLLTLVERLYNEN